MDYLVAEYTSTGIKISVNYVCVFVVLAYDVDVCDIAATDKIATLLATHGVSETGYLLNGNRVFLSPVDSFIFVWRQDGVVCADFEMDIMLLERGDSEMAIFIRNVVFIYCARTFSQHLFMYVLSETTGNLNSTFISNMW